MRYDIKTGMVSSSCIAVLNHISAVARMQGKRVHSIHDEVARTLRFARELS